MQIRCVHQQKAALYIVKLLVIHIVPFFFLHGKFCRHFAAMTTPQNKLHHIASQFLAVVKMLSDYLNVNISVMLHFFVHYFVLFFTSYLCYILHKIIIMVYVVIFSSQCPKNFQKVVFKNVVK